MEIKEILVENIRSFFGRHVIPISPLTIFVGENSTGKTTLMAVYSILIRGNPVVFKPNFNEEPYNLGMFDDIVTKRGGRGGQEQSFKMGCSGVYDRTEFALITEYANLEGKPILRVLNFKAKKFYLELVRKTEGTYNVELFLKSTKSPPFDNINVSELKKPTKKRGLKKISTTIRIPEGVIEDIGLSAILSTILYDSKHGGGRRIRSRYRVFEIVNSIGGFRFLGGRGRKPVSFFSMAPIRAKPERTYETYKEIITAEGNHIPFVLEIADRKKEAPLFDAINDFGKSSGLFEMVKVRPLGRPRGARFELLIKVKGPARNIVDVGYGVSQALPIAVESIRAPANTKFALQQPEVHLHPRAQAALGTLFAKLVGSQNKKFLVETHSDFIINRIRMEAAKNVEGNIKTEDVTIYFTELDGSTTKLHTLLLNKKGEITGQPKSYREFFLKETFDLLSK